MRIPGLARPAAVPRWGPKARLRDPQPASAPDAARYQWVELANAGSEPAAVAGWRLETNAGATELPNLILAPGSSVLVAADPAGLRAQYPLLRAPVVSGLVGGLGPTSDRLVLRDAGGLQVDEMVYGAGGSPGVSEPGRSLVRLDPRLPGTLVSVSSGAKPDGTTPAPFVERIVPGPGGLEAPTSLVAAARRNPPREDTRDVFFASIPTPLEFLGTPLHELASDFLLALLLALIFGAFTTMLNDVVKQEENTLAGLFGSIPVAGPALAALSGRLGGLRAQRTVAALTKLGIMFLVYALLFSGLDPGWRPFGPGGAFLFLTMLGTVALLSTVDGIVQWKMVRRWGVPHDFRFWPFNLVVAALSVGASRIFALRPGLIFGAPGGLDYDADAVDGRKQARLFWAGLAAIIGLGAVAWLASYAFNLAGLAADPGGQAGAGWTRVFAGARNFVLLLFLGALQTVFFEMLPLAGTYGQQVWQRSRLAWAALMVGAAFVMARVMFNPGGDFVAAFSDRPAQFLVLFVALVSAFCIVGWAFLRWRRRAMEQAAA